MIGRDWFNAYIRIKRLLSLKAIFNFQSKIKIQSYRQFKSYIRVAICHKYAIIKVSDFHISLF